MRRGPHLFGKTLGQAFGVSDAQTLLSKSDNITLAAITYVNLPTGLRDATNPQASERGFTIPVHLAQPNSLNWASWVDDRRTQLLTGDVAASEYSTWSHSRECFGILRLRLSTSISPGRLLMRSARTLSFHM
jgi:hypothetical protein